MIDFLTATVEVEAWWLLSIVGMTTAFVVLTSVRQLSNRKYLDRELKQRLEEAAKAREHQA